MGVSLEHYTDRNQTLRYEDATATIAYIGLAVIGASESAPIWQIKRLDSTTGVDVRWADGNAEFDNVWANRASLTYI